ncbi:site-specific integrase [Streptomyces cheonanensis]|uniref:Site-specific integrase n=1 Tax=Streptomyces cheonanensis TaxID=312720 RepID=A0ABP5GPK0_9ACTN|nr:MULTISPECIES: site-specific integrase [Streptomyces]QKV70019.1 site-specific integrase [Streptomyces harbinensis]
MAKRANGEGSITRRKDGTYHGRVYVTTTSGTRKRVSVYGKTREEVRAKVTELQAAEAKGVPQPDTNMTLENYLVYWLARVIKVNRRPKTYQGYESVVRVHLVPGLGKKKIRTLRAAEVRTWLAGVTAECQCCKHGWDAERATPECCAAGECCGRRLSRRMVQSIHAVLRNALQNAVREELIVRNVAQLVQVPTPAYDTGKGLSVADARLLLKEAREDRLYALYVLALAMGMRRGELLGLRWESVNLERGSLIVERSLQRVDGRLTLVRPKTRSSVRTVPLPPLVVKALEEHQERQKQERAALAEDAWTETGLVFTSRVGTALEPDNLRRSWHPLRKRLGLDDLRFHDLRHSCVTLLLDLGVPPHIVQQIAGHSDHSVTMQVYAHASLDEMRKALDKLGDRLS